MFGFENNFPIALAYLLCILSALLCVVYGAITWNAPDDSLNEPDVQWASDEKKMEEEF